MISSAREAAFIALNQSLQTGEFLSDILDKWRKEAILQPREFRLLEELAYGTMRRLYTLDAYAVQLTSQGKLNLKLKEKNLVRLALYQFLFLDKIPSYAIGQEMVQLAKKHTNSRFIPFFSAFIRRFDEAKWQTPRELWQKLSAPPFLIAEFKKRYSVEQIEALFEIFNRPPTPMMRVRSGGVGQFIPFDVEQLGSPLVYVQNPTPAYLMQTLSLQKKSVQKALDLCSAPGGKLLLLHDLYPKAQLTANDPSAERLELVKENLAKYGFDAEIVCQKGEFFDADSGFDLIVLDVPCSNSGVLHKRAEARYRIDSVQLKELLGIQRSLLAHARDLLAPKGQIWYMTCSLLDLENEGMVREACEELGLQVVGEMVRVEPNYEGWDGGFAACLMRKGDV